MAEPFDVAVDDPQAAQQGVTLTPQDGSASDLSQVAPMPAPTPEEAGLLPNLTAILGPSPRLPMPSPPPPAPLATQDPRQQLLALVTLGLALGSGVHGGGAGAFQGFQQGQQLLHDDQMTRWKMATAENDRQRAQVLQQQTQAEKDYSQRENVLRQTLLNFGKDLSTVKDADKYRALVDRYSTALQSYGFRGMTPQWFMQNYKFIPPSEQDLLETAVDKVLNDSLSKQLIGNGQIDRVLAGRVQYQAKRDGQTIPVSVTIGDALKQLGRLPAPNADGSFDLVKTSEANPYRDAHTTAVEEDTAMNGPLPQDPKQLAKRHDWIAARTGEILKTSTPAKDQTDTKDHFTFLPKYDEKGNVIGTMRGNTATGALTDAGDQKIKPPATGSKPLPAQTADNLAGMNTAEVEGVKVLRQLKESGLDQSNNPADPRWQKFMVTTLKVSPRDFNKADIQQRTAFVTAVLTRGLMGGRPSQYVAQMIQQHLPQGEMTGSQLYHVMQNVLEQANERRTEVESLSGRKSGSLAPTSGENYSQFLKNTPSPYLSTDPNAGTPVRGRGGR